MIDKDRFSPSSPFLENVNKRRSLGVYNMYSTDTLFVYEIYSGCDIVIFYVYVRNLDKVRRNKTNSKQP